MDLYEQIQESCKDSQQGIMQYSTVWNNKRVIIRPMKWLNIITVFIKGCEPLEYKLDEEYLKIANDIYSLIK